MQALFKNVSLWFRRVWWAQHNARVLDDMEWRMILLVENATGGRMSKAYYTTEQMNAEVSANHNSIYEDGYNSALEEYQIVLDDAE